MGLMYEQHVVLYSMVVHIDAASNATKGGMREHDGAA
jgi:hypothetical protein